MTAQVKKKLSVTLVRGPIVMGAGSVNNEATPAIGFAYIMGYLKDREYKVQMVDAIGEGLNQFWPFRERPSFQCQGLTFDEILKKIPKDSNVIAFSGMFSGEWPVLRSLINKIRESFPNALFVAGGEHVTALTEYVVRDCLALDVCVRGEGEHTFSEVLRTYSETGSCCDVLGTGYLDESGKYHQVNSDNRIGNTPRMRDIGNIPWPYWPDGYLENFWEAGKSYGVSSERDMPFMLSRGCPYQCTFCSNPQMWTTRYVLRDIDDVIAEIKHYITRYNITSIQLYDLTAITKKKWTVEFLNRLIDENIFLNWSLPSGTRSEVLDKETLELLSKTGCKYLVYAPESGSKDTLIKIKKRIDLAKLTASVLEAKRQGLNTRINLIIGFPHETWRNVFETIKYGLKMSMKGVDEVPLFIFSPYPGTEIFDGLEQRGKLVLNDDYFFSLTSLNGTYTDPNAVVSYSPHLSSKKLGYTRTVFILLNYIVGYLFYPVRIYRTINILLSKNKKASTVFEHRLQDLFKRISRNNIYNDTK